MKTIAFLWVVLVSFTLQAQQDKISSQSLVTVIGEGMVKVTPDQVLIKSRMEHQGDDAQQVKKQNDAAVDRVIKYLKSQDVKEEHIKTDYVNLTRNYNYNDKTYSYVANQAISIHLDDIKNYETIMAGLLKAGLNRIDGVQFKSSQMEQHKAQARINAVQNAKMKAGEYAQAIDQSIGKAVSISEIETHSVPPMYRMEMMKVSSDMEEQQTIAPGEMEVNARVTVSFSLN